MAIAGAINDAALGGVGTDPTRRSAWNSATTALTAGGSQSADSFMLTPPSTRPLLDSSTVALIASTPRTPADTPLSDSSITGKVGDSLSSALKRVASDGTGALSDLLKDPKKVALVTAGIGAAVGVQFIPVAGEAVDVLAGLAGVAMYAAGGQEHKARITQALGEFKQYLDGISSAKTQGQLDAASAHLAKFLEIGGDEAAQALLTVAGAAAAPAKFAGLLSKVEELGGLEGVANAGAATVGKLAETATSLASDAGELASRGWNAIKSAAADASGALESAGREAWQAAGRAIDSAGRALNDGLDWLGRQLGIGGPEPAFAGAGGNVEANGIRPPQNTVHQMSATGASGGGLTQAAQDGLRFLEKNGMQFANRDGHLYSWANRFGTRLDCRDVLEAFRNGTEYFDTRSANYIRYDSTTGVAVVTDGRNGPVITVFDTDRPNSNWNHVRGQH